LLILFFNIFNLILCIGKNLVALIENLIDSISMSVRKMDELKFLYELSDKFD